MYLIHQEFFFQFLRAKNASTQCVAQSCVFRSFLTFMYDWFIINFIINIYIYVYFILLFSFYVLIFVYPSFIFDKEFLFCLLIFIIHVFVLFI